MSKTLRRSIARLPLLGPVIAPVLKAVSDVRDRARFHGSADYWDRTYRRGKTSGPGSYHRLAQFKAEVINGFVEQHGIRSVMEFGCGDGNQLALMRYPQYIGLDVSPYAIDLCMARFAADTTKSFFAYSTFQFRDRSRLFHVDLVLSLDVLYHLVEDDVFIAYLGHLFAAADRYVVIYSSNYDERGRAHVRHRMFTPWVEKIAPEFRLIEHIPNRHVCDPQDPAGRENTSPAEFFIYART